jgi:hypothetical protein
MVKEETVMTEPMTITIRVPVAMTPVTNIQPTTTSAMMYIGGISVVVICASPRTEIPMTT